MAHLKAAEPRDEIRDAITDELRSVLPAALEEVGAELEPCSVEVEDRAALRVEIAKYMRTGTGGWPQAQRDEWLSGAAEDLEQFPAWLVIDAARRARLEVTAPGRFVAWVVADIRPEVDKLRAEEKLIAELMEIASE